MFRIKKIDKSRKINQRMCVEIFVCFFLNKLERNPNCVVSRSYYWLTSQVEYFSPDMNWKGDLFAWIEPTVLYNSPNLTKCSNE